VKNDIDKVIQDFYNVPFLMQNGMDDHKEIRGYNSEYLFYFNLEEFDDIKWLYLNCDKSTYLCQKVARDQNVELKDQLGLPQTTEPVEYVFQVGMNQDDEKSMLLLPMISRDEALQMPLVPDKELRSIGYIQEAENRWYELVNNKYKGGMNSDKTFIEQLTYFITERNYIDIVEYFHWSSSFSTDIMEFGRYDIPAVMVEWEEIKLNKEQSRHFSDGTKDLEEHLKRQADDIEALDIKTNMIREKENKNPSGFSYWLYHDESVPAFTYNEIINRFITKTYFYISLQTTQNQIMVSHDSLQKDKKNVKGKLLKEIMNEKDPVAKALRQAVLERMLFLDLYLLGFESRSYNPEDATLCFYDYICSHDNTEYYCGLFEQEFDREKCIKRCPSSGDFTDDFESGLDNWNLGNAECPLTLGCWKTMTEESNTVLEGKEHSWANAKSVIREIDDFKIDFKMNEGQSHINFITNDDGRYYISIDVSGIGLHRQVNNWQDFEDLKTTEGLVITAGVWHSLEISIDYSEGTDTITAYLDDEEALVYIHDIAFDSGHVSFETLEGSHFYFDDVVVE